MSENDSKHEEGGSHGGSHGGGGHGGGGHAEGEHEGAPEWLISFADNVALMMGFFVILLAMNMGPKADPVQGGPKGQKSESDGPSVGMIDMVISLREAFNRPFDVNSTAPEDQIFIKRIRERNGGEAVNDGPRGTFQETTQVRPTDYREMCATVPFEDNSAVLSQAARRTLIELAGTKLKDQGWIIEVRGHVSPFESRSNVDAAMKLSYERAMAAMHALIEGGVKPGTMRPVMCGDNDRIAPRAFEPEAARSNQRVEVVVTNEHVPADAFTMTSAPSGAAPKD